MLQHRPALLAMLLLLLALAIGTCAPATAAAAATPQNATAAAGPTDAPSVSIFLQQQAKSQLAPLFRNMPRGQQAQLSAEVTYIAEAVWKTLSGVLSCCHAVLRDDHYTAEAKELCRTNISSIRTQAALATIHTGPLQCVRHLIEPQPQDIERFIRDAVEQDALAQKSKSKELDATGNWTPRHAATIMRLLLNTRKNAAILRERFNGIAAPHNAKQPADGFLWDGEYLLRLHMGWLVYSIAADMLVQFHHKVTRPAQFAVCRNASSWYNDNLQLTDVGKQCYVLTKASPLGAPVLDGVAPVTLALVGLKGIQEFEYKHFLSDEPVDYCHIWYDCMGSYAVWLFMWLTCVVAVCYVCWRPDLLVVWKSLHGVRTPSFSDYNRRQRMLANRVRQVNAASSSNGHADNSPAGSPERKVNSNNSSRGSSRAPALTARSSSQRAVPVASPANRGQQQQAASPGRTNNLYLAYCKHLLTECWWPRVCFAVRNCFGVLVFVVVCASVFLAAREAVHRRGAVAVGGKA